MMSTMLGLRGDRVPAPQTARMRLPKDEGPTPRCLVDYPADSPALPATPPGPAPPSHRPFRFRRSPEVGGRWRLRAEEVEEALGGRFPPPSLSRCRAG